MCSYWLTVSFDSSIKKMLDENSKDHLQFFFRYSTVQFTHHVTTCYIKLDDIGGWHQSRYWTGSGMPARTCGCTACSCGVCRSCNHYFHASLCLILNINLRNWFTFVVVFSVQESFVASYSTEYGSVWSFIWIIDSYIQSDFVLFLHKLVFYLNYSQF